MTAIAVEICSRFAPTAASPEIAIAKVAILPVVEATVPAMKGASFSDCSFTFTS
jgi:hypothetical protein